MVGEGRGVARAPNSSPLPSILPGPQRIERRQGGVSCWGARARPPLPPSHGSLGFRLHKLFLFDKASTISCSRGGGARHEPSRDPTIESVAGWGMGARNQPRKLESERALAGWFDRSNGPTSSSFLSFEFREGLVWRRANHPKPLEGLRSIKPKMVKAATHGSLLGCRLTIFTEFDLTTAGNQ